MGLTKKQKAFVEYYLQDWNATQAAIKAGYSKRTAGSIGNENLLKPEIQSEIQRRLSEICMSSDEVLTALGDIGRASIEDLIEIDDSGRMQFDFKRAKEEKKLHLIKSLIPTAHGIRVELHDRMKALELLGKHHKLFTDQIDVTTEGEPINKVIRIVVSDDDDDGDGV